MILKKKKVGTSTENIGVLDTGRSPRSAAKGKFPKDKRKIKPKVRVKPKKDIKPPIDSVMGMGRLQ